MIDITPAGWAILAFSSFLIGISKTGVPGVGILAIPFVAAVLPAKASTGLILPMLIVGDVFAVAYYRQHTVWRHLVRLMPCAAVGIAIGAGLMGVVNDRQLRPIIGGTVLAMLAINQWRSARAQGDLSVPEGWWFPVVMGLLAGVTTMMANAAGPIMTLYLLAMQLPRTVFVGTGAWYFLLLNCFKVPFSRGLGLINPDSVQINLRLAPAIVVGAVLGLFVLKHIPEKAFNQAVQVLAAVAAVNLLAGSLLWAGAFGVALTAFTVVRQRQPSSS